MDAYSVANARRRKQAEEKIEKVLDIYYKGEYENTTEFLRDYGIIPSTFWNYLKRHNLPSLRHTTRKYTMNEDYFSCIDTEEKAYWLGFIQCDGYITKDVIEIGLCSKDISHLEKFKKAIQYTGKITQRKIANKYDSCRMYIRSNKLLQPLVNIGLDKFRSLTMELLMKHDNPLFIHYVRGIIDANANISLKQYVHSVSVNCILSSGSKKFAQEFTNEMNLYCNDNNAVVYKADNDKNFSCRLRKVAYMKLFNDSYKNACISLKRKQEKVNAVLCGSMKNV